MKFFKYNKGFINLIGIFVVEDQVYVRERVPKELIETFLQTILYFLDFSQKERFAKLKKLRESQSALPIAQFR